MKEIEIMAIISLLIITINNANAIPLDGSAPVEQWSKTFGGIKSDGAKSVQQTKDGGYIVAGHTESFGAGDSDVWIIKTDTNGNKQWTKTFGGTNTDEADSIQQTKDGGYIITGLTFSYGAGGGDVWLIKTDSNGNKQWSKTFGGPDWDMAFSVQQTIDNGYIIAAVTMSYGIYGDVWLIKTDVNGNQQWNKTFHKGEDWALSVQQTKDGGYIVGGNTYSSKTGSFDVWLIKTDSNGNQQWSKTFGGLDWDWAESVQQTKDGEYIVAGYTESYKADGDFWLIKIDANGNQQWNKTFGGTGSDWAYSVQQTTDGGYIMAGFTYSYGTSDDFLLIKTDANGNRQWGKTFGGTDDDRAFSIQQTADSGYIVGGYTKSYGAGDSDVWLIKVSGPITVVSPNGGEDWIRGTAQTIRWRPGSNTGSYVKIELLKNGIFNNIISPSTLNDGSYSWTIPSGQPLGRDYKVRITSTSNSLYRDSSNDNFTITSINLLKNPGFEEVYNSLPRYWSKYQSGTKAIFTYPEIGRTGTSKSVTIKYSTIESGKVGIWQQAGITVYPAKQYKLTGYSKLSNVTGGGILPRLNGASLRINWYKSDGGLIRIDLITKSGTIGWTKYEKILTAPSNAVRATVGGDLYNTAGKVWFDDFSFVRIS